MLTINILPFFITTVLFFIFIPTSKTYLLVVSEEQNAGELIFNSSVYKLGSERHYKINQKRSASFVNTLLFVEPHSGQVYLREKISCDGIYYPNLFTLYIDSSSNRLRDVEYYSLPLRILIIGGRCGSRKENWNEKHFNEENRRRRRRSAIEKYYFNTSRSFLDETIDDIPNNDPKLLHTILKNRKRRNVENALFSHADKSTRARVSEARQWIAETYASFAIPTNDRWRKICLKKSQYVNSISAFLPKTVQQFCQVNYLEISDSRFVIEKTQGDLVARDDVCIAEPMWKVIITFRLVLYRFSRLAMAPSVLRNWNCAAHAQMSSWGSRTTLYACTMHYFPL